MLLEGKRLILPRFVITVCWLVAKETPNPFAPLSQHPSGFIRLPTQTTNHNGNDDDDSEDDADKEKLLTWACCVFTSFLGCPYRPLPLKEQLDKAGVQPTFVACGVSPFSER